MLKNTDNIFFTIIIIIILAGLGIFFSASLSVFAKDPLLFKSMILSQVVLGFMGGIVGMVLVSKVNYLFWKKYSALFLALAIITTSLVFIPGLGLMHGGAKRWLDIGPFSFQPVELLKLTYILYFSAWLSWKKNQKNIHFVSYLPIVILSILTVLVLILQPDTKNVILLVVTVSSLLFVSGLAWKKVLIILLIGITMIASVLIFRPYTLDRVKTFLNPSSDPYGSSYQINQGLIAVGSGGISGRGYGKSVQKFGFLPEPQGDSVFAVYAEEFGFVGSATLIIFYLFFVMRGYKIAINAPDNFSKYFCFGIITLIIFQSFLNILSTLGLFPLTGVPLVFISHGGTSLLFTLIALGIMLNISSKKS